MMFSVYRSASKVRKFRIVVMPASLAASKTGLMAYASAAMSVGGL